MKKRIISMFLAIVVVLSTSIIAVNATNKNMSVSFIDCGQGDAILITSGSSAMLVDAGKASNVNNVINYIDSKGITVLDYVVASHFDEDHIGGMPSIYSRYQVKNSIYSPLNTSTQAANNYIYSVTNEQNSVYKTANVADKWSIGNATVDVISDGKEYNNTNDSSVVLKVTCGNTDLLLTGDISSTVERDLINKNASIDAEILKVAHHGSSSSSSQSFLRAVSPKVSVISVGAGNQYGHPTKDTLQRLAAANSPIYRTDLNDTVLLEVTNDVIKYNSKAISNDAVSNDVADNSTIVYVTSTGTKYHFDSSCSNMKTPMAKCLNEAVSLGYTACSKCAKYTPTPSVPAPDNSYQENIAIKSIKGAVVSGIKDKTYTAKSVTQSLTIKLGSTTLKNGTDYTVSYKNNKNIGTATVIITGKGKYSGSIKKTFTIKPKTASVKSFKSSKKKHAKVTWAKDSKVSGYQIVYATNSKFTKGKKTITVKSYKTTSKTIKSLKSKNTYYVKIRSYKIVKSKKIYGAYSKVKKVKVK